MERLRERIRISARSRTQIVESEKSWFSETTTHRSAFVPRIQGPLGALGRMCELAARCLLARRHGSRLLRQDIALQRDYLAPGFKVD
jgi:hypothetical protein